MTSLLASDLDEAEIDAVLERAGFCYDPTRDGKTNRSWLQDIARIAALHVSDGRSERE
ncbi:contact-dependent growth inhibition system immunity protein [Nocardioides kribbensis]|uniref:contact-dependent growth inhibition system immunity protein n=1 Tax=Nocardioides kribbensis TaxID=305517 RepID=UPI003D7F5E41